MGRDPFGHDNFDDYDQAPDRRGMGMGLGHHGSGHHGRRFSRPSTTERIEYLEEFQRDLEEMTEDVASQLAWLKQRDSEKSAT